MTEQEAPICSETCPEKAEASESSKAAAGGDPNADKPLWKWFLGVICLGFMSLCTGSVNLYPAFRTDIKQAFGINDTVANFMLTGGVLILYITLPTGVFMDKFGANLTLLVSTIVTIVSYIILPFTYKIPGVFILFYFLMAFGTCSLFMVALQIVLSRAPYKVKGFSVSIVSAALSLSFGLYLEVYKAGTKVLKCVAYNCVISGFQMVMILVCCVIAVTAPLAYFFYRNFEESGKQEGVKNWKLFCDPKMYILLFGMLMTVFDGLLIVSAGSYVWPLYGKGYPDGAGKWGTAFSVTNCICTIVLSAILDVILNKLNAPRHRWFAFFWLVMGLIPLANAIIFKSTDNEYLFAAFSSMMGIPFGFGLAHIPALTAEVFGNDNYGFAFGIVQIGSIISAASTLSIVAALNKNGIMGAFIVATCLHAIIGLLILFVLKPAAPKEEESSSSDVPNEETKVASQSNTSSSIEVDDEEGSTSSESTENDVVA